MARKGKGFSYNRVAEPPEYTPSASRGTGYAPYIGITEAKEGEDLSYRDDSIGFKRVSRGGGYRNTTGRKLEDKKLRLTDTKLTKPVASGIKLGNSDSGVGFTIDVDAANSKFEVKDNTGSSATKPIVITGGDNNDGSINIDGSGVLTDVNDKFIQNAKFGDFLTASASGGQAGTMAVGQTGYDDGIGVFMGDVGGTFKFSLGNENANKIRWTGDVLDITGAVNVTNASSQSATTTMTGGGITLSGGGAIKSTGKDSATDTTNGFFLGHDGGSSYDFAVGGSSHSMVFDGSAGTLTITGSVTAQEGTIGGWTLSSGALTGDGTGDINIVSTDPGSTRHGVVWFEAGGNTSSDWWTAFHDTSGNSNRFVWNYNGGNKLYLQTDGVMEAVGGFKTTGTNCLISNNITRMTHASTTANWYEIYNTNSALPDDTDLGGIRSYVSDTGTGGTGFNSLMKFQASNASGSERILFRTGNSSSAFWQKFEGDGNVYNHSDSTDWNTDSDERSKTDVVNISNAVTTLGNLRPVTFKYTSDFLEKRPTQDRKRWGFLAQEFKTIIPEAVTESKGYGYDDFHSMNADMLVPILVKAVQELKSEIDTLKSQ